MKKYKTIFYIGRFQPFHNGHKKVVEHALTLAEKVVVVVGSINMSPSTRNPFSYLERSAMITKVFADLVEEGAVEVAGLRDYLYNMNEWVADVQEIASRYSGRMALIGHHRDHTSFYLDAFPQWDLVEVPSFDGINSTLIRDSWYHNKVLTDEPVPKEVSMYINQWSQCKRFDQLVQEKVFIDEYKRKWESAPYKPTFVTVDAVFIHSGHILLVKRKFFPGAGLMALPGGFIGQTETLEEACVRELREETRLKLPEKVIRGSIKSSKVFDHPDRSLRGRTITHAFYFQIDSGPLPKVKGDDDAAEAMWVPLSELKNMDEMMFEDHWFIVKYFVG